MKTKYKNYSLIAREGKTVLGNGEVVEKDDIRIEVLGEMDELNSLLGMAGVEIQRENLMKTSSYIAKAIKFDNKYWQKQIEEMEKEIEEINDKLPRLKSFILSQGKLHYCRAVCRRVERRLITLNRKQKIDEGILIYFDRLSDLLFVLARKYDNI
mgnify:CR=1 FL=1